MLLLLFESLSNETFRAYVFCKQYSYFIRCFRSNFFSQITTSAIKGNSPAANDELLAKEVSAIREEAKSAFELSMRFWVK